MSSPRAPRAQGSGLRDRRARRGRPSPRGRRCCPRCPGERPCPAGLCGKGCPEPREGRHSRTRPSRWPCAPEILTFYTDTATSEKVFAGAGGTWLSPDADDPAGAGLCLVWPPMVQGGCVYGAGKDESETAPKPAPLPPPPPSPGVPQGTQTSALSPNSCSSSSSSSLGKGCGGRGSEGWRAQGGAMAGAALPSWLLTNQNTPSPGD